jgi:hypothetical protein
VSSCSCRVQPLLVVSPCWTHTGDHAHCDGISVNAGGALHADSILELPSDRPAGAHSAELAQPPALEHRRLCEVGHGYGYVHIQPISSAMTCFSRELVYAKSSTESPRVHAS